MKRLLASAAIMASMLAAAPAVAQPYQGYQSNQGYQNGWNSGDFWRGAPSDTWQRIQYLQQRIDRGRQDGSLTPREAYRAQTELRRIRQDAARMRRNGMLDPRYSANIQARLDGLSRSLRWARHNGTGYGDRGYGDRGYGDRGYNTVDYNNYRTTYDARRYYREDPSYTERRLTAQDEVYRGSDGRYYCKRSDGTTGLIVGGAGGALLGNVIDGGHNRLGGTLIGGALGALLGRTVDQNSSDVRCR
jgi:hypothetical protein